MDKPHIFDNLHISRRSALNKIGLGIVSTAFISPAVSSCKNEIDKPAEKDLINPVYFSSVKSLAAAIKSKTLSSVELTRVCLERIEEVNPKINAVVQIVAEEALKTAKIADDALAKGIDLGPLHGIPMTIKDSFDTADIISSAGTLGRANYIPEKDATIVKRLKASGAILLGKTNTPELTLSGDTYNLVYGQTKNPYNLGHIPGGSSGGPAAIIASGGSPFDIGTDTGGSIRGPAHCCGLCGIKPTSGRVPRTGHIITYNDHRQSLTTIGPLARYVEDLTYILPIISGSDGIDPYVFDIPMGNPDEIDISKLKYVFYSNNGIKTPSADVVQAIVNVTEELILAGCGMQELKPPVSEETLEIFNEVFMADRAYAINEILEKAGTNEVSDYLQWVKQFAADAKLISPEEFDSVFDHWSEFRSSMNRYFIPFDIIIAPSYAIAAPEIGADADEHRLNFLSYTSIYNLTGWPAAVVRVGTSPNNLPLGVQIVGKPWQEHKVLAVAKFLEKSFGGFQPPNL